MIQYTLHQHPHRDIFTQTKDEKERNFSITSSPYSFNILSADDDDEEISDSDSLVILCVNGELEKKAKHSIFNSYFAFLSYFGWNFLFRTSGAKAQNFSSFLSLTDSH
jgi:hypothetical protein